MKRKIAWILLLCMIGVLIIPITALADREEEPVWLQENQEQEDIQKPEDVQKPEEEQEEEQVQTPEGQQEEETPTSEEQENQGQLQEDPIQEGMNPVRGGQGREPDRSLSDNVRMHDVLLNYFKYEKTIDMTGAQDRTKIPETGFKFYLREVEDFKPITEETAPDGQPIRLQHGNITKLAGDEEAEQVLFSEVNFSPEDIFSPELKYVMDLPMGIYLDQNRTYRDVLCELYYGGIALPYPYYAINYELDARCREDILNIIGDGASATSYTTGGDLKFNYLFKFAYGLMTSSDHIQTQETRPWVSRDAYAYFMEDENIEQGELETFLGGKYGNFKAPTWLKDTAAWRRFHEGGIGSYEDGAQNLHEYDFRSLDLIKTFNFHLNPAVTYSLSWLGRTNLLSNVETDDQGNYTTISKPLVSPSDAAEIFNKIARYKDSEVRDWAVEQGYEDDEAETYDDGIHRVYRFKLVEETEDSGFSTNTQEKIIDFYMPYYEKEDKYNPALQDDDENYYYKYQYPTNWFGASRLNNFMDARYRIFDSVEEADAYFKAYCALVNDGSSQPYQGVIPLFSYDEPKDAYWGFDDEILDPEFAESHPDGLTEEEKTQVRNFMNQDIPIYKRPYNLQEKDYELVKKCSFVNHYKKSTSPSEPSTPEEPVVEKVWRDKDGNIIKPPTDRVRLELLDDSGKTLSKWLVMEGQDWQVNVDEEDFTVHEVGEKNGKITIDDKTYEVKYEKTENGYRIINILIEKEPETPSIPSIPSTPSNPPNKPTIKIPMIPKAGAY